ncbi:MAG TPA: peptide deformylase [Candidatus Saccharimonadales bacterium]|nr:peptide deformylase [Candidatus Saccharimonadales bacterium]
MEIVKAPNSVLSQKAKTIPAITKQILDLIADMKETLVSAKDPEGVGLAAPQVGKSLQLFIMQPTLNGPISVFINPKVELIGNVKETKADKKDNEQLEGCLSLQNVWGTVRRAPKVSVKYMDETGIEHHKTFTNFPATVIQHEIDHLNGILFPKRVLEQHGRLYKSKKNKQGKDIFEELDL